MARTLLRNATSAPVVLPFPFQRVLGPGVSSIIPQEISLVQKTLGGEGALQNSGLVASVVADSNPADPFLNLYVPDTGTLAAQTLNVSTTGNDLMGDGSVLKPFATPQAALDSLPKRLRYLVDIVLGEGNFPGFIIQGFTFDPANASLACGIRMRGTLKNATLAAGTATGTFSSVTTGNTTADVVFSTVTDSTQTWTVNALKGLFLEVLTGTSALSIVPILANTADTITVPATTAFGAAAGTYAIRDMGTVINTAVAVGASIPASNASSQVPTPIFACAAIQGNVGGPYDLTQLRIEQIKFNPTGTLATGTGGLFVKNNPIVVNRCWIGDGGATSGRPVVCIGSAAGTSTFSNCVINPTVNSSSTGFTLSGSGAIAVTNSLLSSLAAISPFSMVTASGTIQLSVTLCQIDRTGFGITCSGILQLSVVSTRIEQPSNQGVRYRPSQDLVGGCGSVSLSSVAVNNIAASSAFAFQGRVNVFATKLFGGTNQIGIAIDRGCSMKIDALSTITGSTSEVLIDGVTTTLATMRNASPKIITDPNYGTCIWE